MPYAVPTKSNAAWPNKISMCLWPSGSNLALALLSVISSSKTMISLVTGSILRCVSKGDAAKGNRYGHRDATMILVAFSMGSGSPNNYEVILELANSTAHVIEYDLP